VLRSVALTIREGARYVNQADQRVTALFIHSNAAAQPIAGYSEHSPDRVNSGDGIMPRSRRRSKNLRSWSRPASRPVDGPKRLGRWRLLEPRARSRQRPVKQPVLRRGVRIPCDL
jgi:hypothetical protein